MTPPTLTITIKRIGDPSRHEYEAILSRADNDAEIYTNAFTFNPSLLIDMEPQWMLDKAVPRHIHDSLRSDQTVADYQQEQTEKLAGYGQRLYGFLFGDGKELQSFLKYNDAYAKSAHLTLALHSSAAQLWRLPWEYIHDGKDFLALHGKFQLSRRPYELGKLVRDPVQLPLRVLIIVSSPDDANELNTEKEISAIQEALDDAQRHGLIQTEYVDIATLDEIGYMLKNFNPHVVHYTGHGVYREDAKPENSRSYLALEKEDGKMKLAGIADLRPHLHLAPELRLAVLSGCQTAQTSGTDAFSGVATGMLQADIPAVVAMQFSILDSSGIELARAFYTALAQGDTLSAAMQATRLALWQFDEGPGYDWGIPALYLRTEGMVLVDNHQDLSGLQNLTGLSANTLINIDGLPLPRHFVGRKRELRQLRLALRDNQTKSVFIRGMGGMGKSSLAAKLAQRPGTELDGILVIRCHEVDVLDIPGKLASFLQSQGIAGHADAGNLLLNPTLDPAERAQRAAHLVANRRYLIVFDNFESVMTSSSATHLAGASHLADTIPDANLRGLLQGLLTANWRSLCLFTGRYRWHAYEEVVLQETGVEIHLPELTEQQAQMLMNSLSRLRQEPRKTKIAMYRKVGGHPKTIELLNGWLKDGTVSDLLNDPRLDGLLTSQWEAYFLQRLLAKLTAEQQAALTRLSIFQTKLGEEELAYAAVDETLLRRWLDLSLLQRERGEAAPLPPQMAALLEMLPPAEQAKLKAQSQAPDRYTVHPVVAEYLLAQTTAAERQALHRWAAAFYGQPFVEMARNYAAQSGQTWTDEEIEALARDARGVVGQMVARTDDMGQARGAMARALAWQGHLFAAGEVDAADDIINAVWYMLVRWGECDRAKGLLRRSLESLEGFRKASAQSNFATLLMNEGELAEALAIYQEVYEIFATLDTKQQMASVLGQMGYIYEGKGDLDKAIEVSEKALALHEEIDYKREQAIGLHQLAMLYHSKREYVIALAHCKASEALARQVKDEALVALALHGQGTTYNFIARAAESYERREEYWEIASSCFEESITINRRIGNYIVVADTLVAMSMIFVADKKMVEAISALNEALEFQKSLGNPVKIAITLEHLGQIHERQGQYIAALTQYQEALALFQQYGSPQDTAIVQNDIARVQAKLGGG